jgi:hypothetical protein
MKHIHFATSNTEFETLNLKVAGNALLSLFDNFGDIAQKIQKLRDYSQMAQANSAELFIDSGINNISGRVTPEFDESAEEYYLEFLANEEYDYIFSPDLPLGLRLDQAALYDLGYKTIHKTLEIVKKNPAIRDKFFLTQHLKSPGRKEVWEALDKELEISKHVTHRAITGLSKGSNRGAEFTILGNTIFRLFNDHIESGNDVFRIHLMGIDSPQERFTVAMMEKILNRYAKKNHHRSKTILTYDSAKYVQDGWHKTLTMSFWQYKDGKPSRYRYDNIPDSTLQQIYGKSEYLIKKAIENLKIGQSCSDAFIPLSIYSQKNLDAFFMEVIDGFKILDTIDTQGKKVLPTRRLENLRDELREEFKSKLFPDKIIHDLKHASGLYHWLFYDREPEKLDLATQKLI